MADTIRGLVTKIIDGDTFDMDVTHVGTNNSNRYNQKERVRIANIDEPELRSAAGRRSKDRLERELRGKNVRCYVQSRDIYSRIVAEVVVL